ncbi:MAG: ABC-F family ATP-binding cassette domain-containing protein [Pseudomonadota bacterium]
MISINDLSMHYGAKLLFDGVNLNLNSGERYGVVGANGTGKSTFLRLLAGQEDASLGDITIAKSASLGWLHQDHFQYEKNTVIETVLQGRPVLWSALQEKEHLFAQENWTDAMGYRVAELEEVVAQQDGYSAESFAQTLLTGLGLAQSKHFRPMSELSGGYKLRVLLAQALFNDPDILILDEPTNHLDIMTIAWLESYLKRDFQGLLIFISHDQDFLNNLATQILDIDYGEIRAYTGNYDYFQKEKHAVVEQKLHIKQSMEKKIAHMQRFVDRFRASASRSKQALSKQRMIERMELPDIKKSSRIHPNLQFNIKRPSGKTVLKVEKICKRYSDKDVLKNVSFEINRGEKVAFIGHNGIGKSTLLKSLLNLVSLDSGTFIWGHEAYCSYFSQNPDELLQDDHSILSWLSAQNPKATDSEIRGTLGMVLFTQDDVHKNIQTLSGGEASRLVLAKVMLEKSNVLILDEPTNHLDLEAIESLSRALKKFAGTLLLVSHDRHFVTKIPNRIVSLTESGYKDFKGSYHEYLDYYGEDYLSRTWLKVKKQ